MVSLKDAHDSGAKNWTNEQKSQFANDPFNLVPSCARVNRSKSALTPSGFLKRSTDGRGVEVDWQSNRWCRYVLKYKSVKIKYSLSFQNNNSEIFEKCSN